MLVTYSMMAGGAERVAATLANHWVSNGCQVTLVTVTSSASDFYDLDSRINRLGLDLSNASWTWSEFITNNLSIIRRLRATILEAKPQIILSFIDVVNLRVLLAAAGTGVPVVVEEHTNPSVYSIGKIPTLLRRLLYPRAQAVVVLTQDVARWASGLVAERSIYVIPNPIGDQFLNRCRPLISRSGRTVVAVGRLVSEKGFDLLVRAFAACSPDHPDWGLNIVGEGPERGRLEKLAEELGIGSRVTLRGAVKNPERILQQSDLFVLSSRYEGFPMALLEAMASGLPVISFDCRSGPREMIQNGKNGLLVPPNDVSGLAQAMSRLMGAEEERRKFGEYAAAVALQFRVANIDRMWRSLFEQAICRRNARLERPQPYDSSIRKTGAITDVD
jgi:glycosyltransferase involved in cell wall biosynthesis